MPCGNCLPRHVINLAVFRVARRIRPASQLASWPAGRLGMLLATSCPRQFSGGSAMPINLDTYLGVHAKALPLRSQRTELIAANIANADTPGYRARDIDF